MEKEEIKNIKQVSDRELYMKTCDLMYTHYRILGIIDAETAIRIIKGVLEEPIDSPL